MSEGRWDRLAADLKTAGFDVKVDTLPYPGGISRSITVIIPGKGLVAITDAWWRKNLDVWIGWQVTAENTGSIIIGRPSRTSKKRSETVAAFRCSGRQTVTGAMNTPSTETIWMYDTPGSGYHDHARCRCGRHCRNCFEDLDEVRAVRARMIAAGTIPATDRLGPRERYCSPYCRNRAKRDRALDRMLAAGTVTGQ